MKTFEIVGNPFLMICLFLIILISGESIGGVYMLYLLLALPHAGIHAILAIFGIGLIIYGRIKLKTINPAITKVMHLAGIILLILSLVTFFYNDKQGYNYGSFDSPAFWTTSGLFVMSALSSLVKMFLPVRRGKNNLPLNLV
jgi:nitrate reductase gamma subunit